MKCIPLLFGLLACVQAGSRKKEELPSVPVSAAVTTPKLPAAEAARYHDAIEEFVDSTFKHSVLNGAILVAKDGEILYEKYAGFRNPRRRQDSITANTAFHLASVSKTFTATAILKLWQEHRLDINDSLTKYFPAFPYKGVTIKTLLDHRSGIPKYDHYMELLGWDKRKAVTNQDVLNFIIQHPQEIHAWAPDRKFSYSNTNFALLALVIEKVSGMPYPQFMQQTFFDSLGMTHTFVYTPADSARALDSYHYNGRPYPFDYLDLVYGDKNIYSTARDLMKWDQALRNGLLNKEVLQAAYTPYSFERPGIRNYGLGWRMYVLRNGKKLIYHNGWWHGNRPSFYRLLDENTVIIGLCNNDNRYMYRVKCMADLFGDYMQSGGSLREEEDNDSETNVTVRPQRRRPSHHAYAAASHKKRHARLYAAKK